MGRMTRYLKQTAQHEKIVKLPDGSTQLDAYGKPLYQQAVTVKCRKEPARMSNSSSLGQFVNYATAYYLDETVDICVQDKLDGEVVLQVYDYRDGTGKLVGYEVHV